MKALMLLIGVILCVSLDMAISQMDPEIQGKFIIEQWESYITNLAQITLQHGRWISFNLQTYHFRVFEKLTHLIRHCLYKWSWEAVTEMSPCGERNFNLSSRTPLLYPSRVSLWKLEVPDPFKINLTFIRFQLLTSQGQCEIERLDIKYGDESKTYCGHRKTWSHIIPTYTTSLIYTGHTALVNTVQYRMGEIRIRVRYQVVNFIDTRGQDEYWLSLQGIARYHDQFQIDHSHGSWLNRWQFAYPQAAPGLYFKGTLTYNIIVMVDYTRRVVGKVLGNVDPCVDVTLYAGPHSHSPTLTQTHQYPTFVSLAVIVHKLSDLNCNLNSPKISSKYQFKVILYTPVKTIHVGEATLQNLLPDANYCTQTGEGGAICDVFLEAPEHMYVEVSVKSLDWAGANPQGCLYKGIVIIDERRAKHLYNSLRVLAIDFLMPLVILCDQSLNQNSETFEILPQRFVSTTRRIRILFYHYHMTGSRFTARLQHVANRCIGYFIYCGRVTLNISTLVLFQLYNYKQFSQLNPGLSGKELRHFPSNFKCPYLSHKSFMGSVFFCHNGSHFQVATMLNIDCYHLQFHRASQRRLTRNCKASAYTWSGGSALTLVNHTATSPYSLNEACTTLRTSLVRKVKDLFVFSFNPSCHTSVTYIRTEAVEPLHIFRVRSQFDFTNPYTDLSLKHRLYQGEFKSSNLFVFDETQQDGEAMYFTLFNEKVQRTFQQSNMYSIRLTSPGCHHIRLKYTFLTEIVKIAKIFPFFSSCAIGIIDLTNTSILSFSYTQIYTYLTLILQQEVVGKAQACAVSVTTTPIPFVNTLSWQSVQYTYQRMDLTYVVIYDEMSIVWADAAKMCRSFGGHLPSIHGEADEDMLKNLLLGIPLNDGEPLRTPARIHHTTILFLGLNNSEVRHQPLLLCSCTNF